MRLVGAPTTILVDDSECGPGIVAMMRGLELAVARDIRELRAATAPTVAVFSHALPPIVGCYGWYVGENAAPDWLHPVSGPNGTARILGLLGTSFAQERAGAAFRAASRGAPAPESTPFDMQGVLDGITRAVGDRPPVPARVPAHLDAASRAHLLRTSFKVMDHCCVLTGAIAAAPRSRVGPDYWFAWQRDGAHVAHALHLIHMHGPDADMRHRAGVRREAWVRFVTEHVSGADLAASRRRMTGEVVGGYGDPQQDGPASTALVLLTVIAGAHDALAAARPFLDYLLSDAAGEPGYDLWELTFGHSFYAANLRRRALIRATRLAREVGDAAADRYHQASIAASHELRRFRSPLRPGLVSTRNATPSWFNLVSGLDMSVIGSALLAYDPRDDQGDEHDAAIRETFDQIRQWSGTGRGVGRFPEDCNDGMGSTGANPWTVTTLWAAQRLLREGGDSIRDGVGYLLDVLAGDAGALGEQFEASSGQARGVAPLAWAHAELVVTVLALDQSISASRRPC
jgi:hypothetical protein